MKNKLAVDFVGKYENLLEDLNFICKKLKISSEDGLPSTKKELEKIKDITPKFLTKNKPITLKLNVRKK